jgi:hypothetical protein
VNELVWWYESNGAQAGPVPDSVLLDLVRSGRLSPRARVWRSGMPGWQPVASVPELAAAIPVPPPLDPGPAAATLPAGMERVPTGAVIGFGILTLGIYPIVKFYQAALAYEELARRRTRFTLYFWIAAGLWIGGGPMHVLGGVPGWIAHVGALVLTMMTLFEVLAVRAEAMHRTRIAPPVTSDTTHKVLFVVGLLTAWALVGVVLLLVQTVKFFTDHAAIGEALRSRAVPDPRAVAPPSGPPVTG